jgi:hypothetical protein
MGVGDDAEYGASLAAVEEGLKDFEAGRSRTLDQFFRELDKRHGLAD